MNPDAPADRARGMDVKHCGRRRLHSDSAIPFAGHHFRLRGKASVRECGKHPAVCRRQRGRARASPGCTASPPPDGAAGRTAAEHLGRLKIRYETALGAQLSHEHVRKDGVVFQPAGPGAPCLAGPVNHLAGQGAPLARTPRPPPRPARGPDSRPCHAVMARSTVTATPRDLRPRRTSPPATRDSRSSDNTRRGGCPPER